MTPKEIIDSDGIVYGPQEAPDHPWIYKGSGIAPYFQKIEEAIEANEKKDVVTIQAKNIRNLARIYQTVNYLYSKGQPTEDQLEAFMDVTLDILQETGIDRRDFKDLEVLE